MSPRRAAAAALAMLAALTATTSCRNPMRQTVEEVVRIYATPTVGIDFPDGAGIAPRTPIVVTYSESMDKATLVLTGALADSSDGGVWSTTVNPDDTLTLSPAGTWPLGSDQTLGVEASDLESYPAPPVQVSYGVLDGAVYVHATAGSDANPGTAAMPKATIQSAVDTLERVFDAGEVRIAAGTHVLRQGIIVRKDLAILGGYSPDDWGVRDHSTFTTLLSHVALQGTVATVTFAPGVTQAALLEGVTISGPSATSSSLVYCTSASPTIRHNILEVGGPHKGTGISLEESSSLVEDNYIDIGASALTGVGIMAIGSKATIRANTIRGDLCESFCAISLDTSDATIVGNRIRGPSTAYQNWGIVMVSSDPTIRNNVIDPGRMVNSSDPTGCEGMILQASSPIIQNNIVSGGYASSLGNHAAATAITLLGSSTPVIENNIIITVGGDLRTGIWQNDSGSNPRLCNNNFFYGCPDGYYYYGPTNDAYLSAASRLEAFLTGRGVQAGGNVFSATDPGLTSADWSYTATSPASATAGGKDLSAVFTTDIGGTARTVPWSIGAFEKD